MGTFNAEYLGDGNFYISKMCSVSPDLIHKTEQHVVLVPE